MYDVQGGPEVGYYSIKRLSFRLEIEYRYAQYLCHFKAEVTPFIFPESIFVYLKFLPFSKHFLFSPIWRYSIHGAIKKF